MKLQPRIPTLLCASLTLLVLAAHVHAQESNAEPSESPVIHYFKQPKPLALLPQTIAVELGNGVTPRQFAETRSEHDPRVLAIDPHPVQGWSLVRHEALDRSEDVRALVRDIASSTNVRFVSPVFVDDLGGPMFATADILVGFDPQTDPKRAELIVSALVPGTIRDRDYGNMKNVYRVTSTSKNGFEVLAQANALIALPEVLFAEPDMVFTGRGALIPNDPSFSQCWGLRNTGQSGGTADMDMDAELAWDITTGDPGIIVVVIDTGVDQTHPDITQFTPGTDSTTDNGDGGPINSFDNHGTPVAGCVSATINNSLGTVGIAPNCRSASARTFISTNAAGNWSSTASWTVDSLTWAEMINARVTNNSNFYGFTSSAISTKYSATRTAGMIHFASAGNDSGGPVTYPANLPTVNAIAAINRNGNQASFSNEGPQLDLAAPGETINTTDRQGAAGWSSNDYNSGVDGTSFASPYAAGCAALVLSFNPNLTAVDVEDILYMTAVDRGVAGFDNIFGWGIVNAHQALLAAQPPAPPGDFDLLTPSEDQRMISLSPFFQWSQASNVDEYHLVVDDDESFATPEIDVFTFLSTYQAIGDPLEQATRYYWKVTASNSFGNTDSTPFSSTFVTDGPLPQVFVLAAPQPATVVDSLTPTFAWTESGGAENYVFEVDDDSDFSSPAILENVAPGMGGLREQTPAVPLQNAQTYWWRVTAENLVGPTASIPASIQFSVAVPSGCEGDADGSMTVDVNDISYIVFRLGLSVPDDQGADVDGSGTVDVNDITYTVFRLGTCQ